ncbi:hypothetical protein CDL60_19815 [Roseateles noduli]|nr:hypothetical protein CDL60_19815 [Roseateles noduli]
MKRRRYFEPTLFAISGVVALILLVHVPILAMALRRSFLAFFYFPVVFVSSVWFYGVCDRFACRFRGYSYHGDEH